nr:zinc finger, CCHC-type [Tanacetum cinerariifolium]
LLVNFKKNILSSYYYQYKEVTAAQDEVSVAQELQRNILNGKKRCISCFPIPEDGDNAIVEQLRKRAKWDNNDYVCRGLIFNGMSDSLFDIYQSVESSKELWDSLDAKYMAEDASSKKFLVSNIINYKMTDSRPVFEQYNELLDFKHTLKHLKEELTLVELGTHLHIEESFRNDNKGKRKHQDNTRANPNKKAKHTCWKCGKTGHIKRDCKGVNVGNKANASGTKVLVDGSSKSLKATLSLGNKKYFVTFIDDASRFCYVYLLHTKDEALDKFKVFKTKVKLQQGSMIKRFRTDMGVSINFIIESIDAIFDEILFFLIPRPSINDPKGTKHIGGSVVPEKVTKEVVKQPEPELRKIKRNMPLKNFRPGFQSYLIEETKDEIFKRKLKVDGTIEKFKARLVIQGFRQKLGINYFDTYALVACISTIRLLIAMASIKNLIIHQMDVKTSFLNGELDEEVYTNQHRGFIMPSNKNKEFLSSKFFMKDMEKAGVILGIRIKHRSNEIAISQSYYIEKVLKKFNFFDCTPVNTPMDTSKKLMPNIGQAVSQLENSRVIGFLMHAMSRTRPNIAFAVGKLSKYTSNPGTQHWQAIQRVLKYLKKTMDYRLTYIGYSSVLEEYTDASWINNTKDNSSTSGWVFLLGGGAQFLGLPRSKLALLVQQ